MLEKQRVAIVAIHFVAIRVQEACWHRSASPISYYIMEVLQKTSRLPLDGLNSSDLLVL